MSGFSSQFPGASWINGTPKKANGLLGLLGVSSNPFVDFLSNNSNALIGLGAGIAGGGPDLGQAVGQGLTLAGQGKTADFNRSEKAKADALLASQTNQTQAWLAKNRPDLAGLPVDQAWQVAMKGTGGGNDPASIQEYNLYRQQTEQAGQKPMSFIDYKQNNVSSLTPESLDLIATQYLAGDKSAIVGYARNATMRSQIANAIAEKANSLGLDGAAIAAQISAYGGNVAAQRSAGTRAAQVGMAASEANQMADLALTASTEVPRSQFVPWNQAVQMYEHGTSDPKLARLVAATMSLVNAYARAVSPLGTPTDAMRAHAEQMLNNAQSQEAYAAVIDQMKKEMVAALNAPQEISTQLKSAVTDPGGAPAVTSPAGPGPSTSTGDPELDRALQQYGQ